jgi:hypothetical protein
VVYILEKAVDEIITKYSHFDEIAEAINQFILENASLDKEEKASTKESELEIQVEMEKVSDKADKREPSETLEKKTKKKEDKDSKKEGKGSKKKDKNLRKSQGKEITYSSQEEQLLAENFYQSNVDYDQLSSYSFNQNIKGEVYEQGKITQAYSDAQDEQISAVEASETMREVQFAALLGSKTEVSYIKRKKMATWTLFNSAEFRMFETMHGLTRDVDYSKTF